MKRPFTVVYALCGSYCTFDKTLPQMAALAEKGVAILPVMSFNAAGLDTRFGRASDWKAKITDLTGKKILETLQAVEPLGPRDLADAMVIAPCTGTTLAKLALGLSDTPVTLAAKSMLRGGKPVLLAVSTNDGLGASAANLAALLNRKGFYLVPLRQDDPAAKPNSLQSDFEKIPDCLAEAVQGRQQEPLLLAPGGNTCTEEGKRL